MYNIMVIGSFLGALSSSARGLGVRHTRAPPGAFEYKVSETLNIVSHCTVLEKCFFSYHPFEKAPVQYYHITSVTSVM